MCPVLLQGACLGFGRTTLHHRGCLVPFPRSPSSSLQHAWLHRRIYWYHVRVTGGVRPFRFWNGPLGLLLGSLPISVRSPGVVNVLCGQFLTLRYLASEPSAWACFYECVHGLVVFDFGLQENVHVGSGFSILCCTSPAWIFGEALLLWAWGTPPNTGFILAGFEAVVDPDSPQRADHSASFLA